jgi:N-sulfoglucosamine sulfohydrolase
MKRREFLATTASATLSCLVMGCNLETKTLMPNILFCIADDASYPHMGAYGCQWVNTPGFDKVANNGLLFTNAYTPNAKCAPSRASILTGRNSWQLEEAANHWCFFPNKFKTYAEALSENGYYVGFTAKGWAPGIPGEINGKQRQLTGLPFNNKKSIPPANHISNNDYAANFSDFLESRPEDKPFCFWYGGREPHRRYEYEAGINKGGKKLSDIDKVYSFWPDNDTIKTDMLDYAYEIEYFDQHLQKMIQVLEEKGELDNTIVIVTADNGMPFPRIKGQEYEYSNHMPLAMMWKNGINNPGRTVNDFVNFIDLAPTYLELAGITQNESGMRPMEGKSLTDIFNSQKSGNINPDRNFVLIGKERHDVGRPNDAGYPIRGIVKDDYLYIKNFEPSRWPAGNPETGYLNCDGSPTKTEVLNLKRNKQNQEYWNCSFGKRPQEELYNIKNDRECMNNLADMDEFEGQKSKLKNQLFAELKKQGDPRMFGKGYIFDEYLYGDTNTKNFYERYMRGEKLNSGWVNNSDFEK